MLRLSAPQLWGCFFWADELGEASTGGILAAMHPDPDAFLLDSFGGADAASSHDAWVTDQRSVEGTARTLHLWPSGRMPVPTTYDVGRTAPELGSFTVGSAPLNPKERETLYPADTFLDDYIAAMLTRIHLQDAVILYQGMQKLGVATDNATLDEHYALATALGPKAISAWDAQGVLPYKTAVDPSTVSGLIHRWTPGVGSYSDAGVTLAVNNDPVRQQNDRIGVNHLTQATLGNRPLYIASGVNGQPVLRFDGTDDWMGMTSAVSGHAAHTILVFFKTTAATGCLFSDSTSIMTCVVNEVDAGSLSSYNGSVGNLVRSAGASFPANTFGVAVFRATGTSQHLYTNEAENSYVAGPGSWSSTGFRINRLGFLDNGGPTWYINADIRDILIYNRALTVTEIRQIAVGILDDHAVGGLAGGTFPHQRLVERMYSQGYRVIEEAFGRKDFAEGSGWNKYLFGGLADAGVGNSFELAYASSNTRLKPDYKTLGALPIVRVPFVFGNAAQRTAEMARIMRLGYSVALEAGGFTASEQLTAIRLAWSITRTFSQRPNLLMS